LRLVLDFHSKVIFFFMIILFKRSMIIYFECFLTFLLFLLLFQCWYIGRIAMFPDSCFEVSSVWGFRWSRIIFVVMHSLFLHTAFVCKDDT
jgi:hypothetical protein